MISIIHTAPEGAADDTRRRVHGLLKTAGCEAEVHLSIGPLKQALLDGTQRLAADALIVGRRPRTGALGRLRDLTYSMVRDSPVPVLSV